MSEANQIKEMSEAILRVNDNYDTTLREDCETIASLIYEAGYRKQSEGEWVDNYNGTFTCTVCGGRASKMNYCGRCGAKMKDGVE